MRSAEVRYKSEAEFHDTAYQEHLRKDASKYYQLMDNCSRYYRQYLKTHCLGRTVLEYGCGENSAAKFLSEQGAQQVVGIDISAVAIEQARQTAVAEGRRSVKYQVMNAEALEFEDDSFDLICGIAILHHLDLSRAYREIARTLRPGGSAIFLEPLAHNAIINLYRRLTPRLRTPDEHPLFMRDIALARTYFEAIEMEYFNLSSFLALPCRNLSIFPSLVRGFNAIDRAAFRTAPFLGRYAWTTALVMTSPRKPVPGAGTGAAENRIGAK